MPLLSPDVTSVFPLVRHSALFSDRHMDCNLSGEVCKRGGMSYEDREQ
jgi:hypothetical protein